MNIYLYTVKVDYLCFPCEKSLKFLFSLAISVKQIRNDFLLVENQSNLGKINNQLKI